MDGAPRRDVLMSTPLELPPGNAPICRIREFDQELGGASYRRLCDE